MITFAGRIIRRIAAILGSWTKVASSLVLRLVHRGARPAPGDVEQQDLPPVSMKVHASDDTYHESHA